IGILMAGLARLARGGTTLRFIVYVVAAALFHRTAIVMLPLVILSGERNRTLNLVLALAFSFILYDFFLSGTADRFVTNYIRAAYNSQGAAIRVAMSIVPATIFLLNQRRFGFSPQQIKMWRNFSLAAFLFLLLLIVLPSSTAVDRLALYITPLQIAVLARIPLAYRSNIAKFLIILYSFAVQFVWLNYADNAGAWVPYQLYPFS
ncbi:EpsG family protein, partial [Sphingomonas sp.]|uniref:EpsG family protein n=1 Tax=Sphingomonas sp. TaxID=28214 RepID=UPI00286B8350